MTTTDWVASPLRSARMTKRYVLRSIGILLVPIGVLYLFAPRSGSSEHRVCAKCAVVVKHVEFRFAGVPYIRRNTFQQSAMSIALSQDPCKHKLLPYQSSEIVEMWGLPERPTLYGDSLSPIMLRFLLEDEALANEFVKLPDASKKWRSLVVAITTDSWIDKPFSQWYFTDDARPPLDQWWKKHLSDSVKAPQAEQGEGDNSE